DLDEGAVTLVLVQRVRPELVGKVKVIMAVPVIVTDGQAAAVVVEVRLKLLPLFVRQEAHAKRDPDFARPVLKPARAARIGRAGPLRAARLARRRVFLNRPTAANYKAGNDQHDNEDGRPKAQVKSRFLGHGCTS